MVCTYRRGAALSNILLLQWLPQFQWTWHLPADLPGCLLRRSTQREQIMGMAVFTARVYDRFLVHFHCGVLSVFMTSLLRENHA